MAETAYRSVFDPGTDGDDCYYSADDVVRWIHSKLDLSPSDVERLFAKLNVAVVDDIARNPLIHGLLNTWAKFDRCDMVDAFCNHWKTVPYEFSDPQGDQRVRDVDLWCERCFDKIIGPGWRASYRDAKTICWSASRRDLLTPRAKRLLETAVTCLEDDGKSVPRELLARESPQIDELLHRHPRAYMSYTISDLLKEWDLVSPGVRTGGWGSSAMAPDKVLRISRKLGISGDYGKLKKKITRSRMAGFLRAGGLDVVRVTPEDAKRDFYKHPEMVALLRQEDLLETFSSFSSPELLLLCQRAESNTVAETALAKVWQRFPDAFYMADGVLGFLRCNKRCVVMAMIRRAVARELGTTIATGMGDPECPMSMLDADIMKFILILAMQ